MALVRIVALVRVVDLARDPCSEGRGARDEWQRSEEEGTSEGSSEGPGARSEWS